MAAFAIIQSQIVSFDREGKHGEQRAGLQAFSQVLNHVDLEIRKIGRVHHCRAEQRVDAQAFAHESENGEEALGHVEQRVHEHVLVHSIVFEVLFLVALVSDDQHNQQIGNES